MLKSLLFLAIVGTYLSTAVIASAATADTRPATTEPKQENKQPDKKATDAETPPPKIRFAQGNGLSITSGNGRFRLTTNVFAQLLYRAIHQRDDTDRWNEENTEQAFQVRRARLIFGGHLYNRHNKFYLQLAFSPIDMQLTDGTVTKTPIFDWFFRFDYLRDLTFQIGQYRVPYSKQRRIPYAKLQFVDRTRANFEFNLDRDIGFSFRSGDFLGLKLLRYHAGVFIGEGRDGYGAADFGMLFCGRIEIHPLGLFGDYIEADLKRRKRPGLAIGAAYAYLGNAKRNRGILGRVPSDGGTTDTHNATADLMFKIAGVSIFSEFYYRKGQRTFGDATIEDETGQVVLEPREDPRDGLGWFAQLGWVVPVIPLEVVGRYSQVHPLGDSSLNPDEDQVGERGDEVGAGINWYIFGPSMVLSADYHHWFDRGTIDTGSDSIRLSFQAGF
jgi:phosphate-selective porin OprO/OprP